LAERLVAATNPIIVSRCGRDLATIPLLVELSVNSSGSPGPRQPKRRAIVAVIEPDPVKLRIPTYGQMATIRLRSDARLGLQALLAAPPRG
jgi:hypothetical protein